MMIDKLGMYLTFGYLIMNIFSASANLSGDVCSTLFGSTSILTLTQKEVWLCIVLSQKSVLQKKMQELINMPLLEDGEIDG